MILEFLLSHIDLLIEFVLFIIVILITLFKKKVKVNTIFERLLCVLPSFINLAESQFSDGNEKFSFVFNKCVEYIELLSGEKQDEILSNYAKRISIAIENILSTPTKKKGEIK